MLSCGGSFYVAIGKSIQLKKPLADKSTKSKSLSINYLGCISLRGNMKTDISKIILPDEIMKTISSNYINDTLEPFRSRKSSANQNVSVNGKKSMKTIKNAIPKLDVISRNFQKEKRFR